MTKPKLFIDFDETITGSVKAYCDAYNEIYQNHSEFKPADWTKSVAWDIRDVCPLVSDVNQIFGSKEFFYYCDFYDEFTCDALKKLNEHYEIVIVSIGIPENISLKSMWIKKNLPFIKETVLLCNNACRMSKEIVNMKNGILIDDVKSNLDSSNAKHKICFGEKKEWNQFWEGRRYYSWKTLFTGLTLNLD
jgi:5'(3')-deoxyribonucleotidase